MHLSPLDILVHVPFFVWAILLLILYFGLKQTADSAMRAKRLVVLPALWLWFGVWGVQRSFGLDGIPGLGWAAGLAVGVIAVRALRWPGNVRFDASSQRFLVPGSWIPLALMLGIFALKFAAGVGLALHPEYARQLAFSVGCSAAFGLFSGAFLGRSLNILAARPRRGEALAA